jgi:hypothetical protein
MEIDCMSQFDEETMFPPEVSQSLEVEFESVSYLTDSYSPLKMDSTS